MTHHRYLVHLLIGFMLLGAQTVWADASPKPADNLLCTRSQGKLFENQ